MIVLALDTTSPNASIAVHRDGETICERTLQSDEGFAHLLFPAISDALRQAGVSLNEVDCFASATGPGSFTGVRVGLSAVKGLAEALSKPAYGISNLRVLASFGRLTLRAVSIDARRGEIYGAVYDASLCVVQAEAVLLRQAWLDSLPEGAEEVTDVPVYLAAAIARCAVLDGITAWQDPAPLDANYVRRSDAELFWKDS